MRNFIALFSLLFVTFAAARAESGRAMLPQDILRQQSIDDAAISPDGQWVAVSISRPNQLGECPYSTKIDYNRNDIWLVHPDGTGLTNVTASKAGVDGCKPGYWMPRWSSDGRWLAMLSVERSGARLAVLDMQSRQLRTLATADVDLALYAQVAGRASNDGDTHDWIGTPFTWLDRDSLIVGLLPAGAHSLMFDIGHRKVRTAAAGDQAAIDGRQVTANVLSSGDPAYTPPDVGEVSIVKIDVTTGQSTTITRLPLIETWIARRRLEISPSTRRAIVVAAEYPSKLFRGEVPEHLRLADFTPLRLGHFPLVANAEVQWLPQVRFDAAWMNEASLFSSPRAIAWSPREGSFAILAEGTEPTAPCPLIVELSGGKPQQASICAPAADKLFVATALEWTPAGELLTYGGWRAQRPSDSSFHPVKAAATERNDWWLIDGGKSAKNLTSGLTAVQSVVLAGAERGRIVAVDAKGVWQIETAGAKAQALALPGARLPYSATQTWTKESGGSAALLIEEATSLPGRMFVATMAPGRPSLQSLGELPQGASVMGLRSDDGLLLYRTNDTRLIAQHSSPSSGPAFEKTLVSLNRELDSIAAPQFVSFEYESGTGQKLLGSLLLPHGYESGRRYPVVVEVYGGRIARRDGWADAYTYAASSMIFAGHGYAVLRPSIPVNFRGADTNLPQDFIDTVVPAVHKAAQLGYVDGERAGVIGASFGGYTVMSLVGHTGLFRAAVSEVPVGDVRSAANMLDPANPFSAHAMPLQWSLVIEDSQWKLQVPPWVDPSRYLRNSPYAFVGKVTTPLLIMTGTEDLGMNSEPFFIGLARQGKRVEWVRYFGEGHDVRSPANILDRWQRRLDWFDRYLQPRN